MKIKFPAWLSYGRHDYTDWDVEVDITEEEYQRLVQSAKENNTFDADETVRDIYDKVFDAMLDVELEVLEPEDIVDRMASFRGISFEEADNQEFEYDEIKEMLQWEGGYGVGYPESFGDEKQD